MIAGVIFDVDGTLVDSVDLHAKAWQDAFRHFGFEVPYPRVREQIGKGADQLMPALIPQDVVDRRGQEISQYRSDYFKKQYLPKVRPFPNVRPLFERILADGTRIALASSAKGDELDAYKRIAGIDDLIHAATSSSDAKHSKPEPDIFQAALGQLEPIQRDKVIVVGDTPYDIQAARRAGLRAIGLLSGGWPADRLRQEGATAVYPDPADLLAHYDESPLAHRS